MDRVNTASSGLFTDYNNTGEKISKSDTQDKDSSPVKIPKKSNLNHFDRPIANMASLSPIAQYKYMASGGNSEYAQANLKEIPGNPEATIRRANLVINSATLPPMLSNPDKEMLDEAIQLKRRMEKRLDKVA